MFPATPLKYRAVGPERAEGPGMVVKVSVPYSVPVLPLPLESGNEVPPGGSLLPVGDQTIGPDWGAVRQGTRPTTITEWHDTCKFLRFRSGCFEVTNSRGGTPRAERRAWHP